MPCILHNIYSHYYRFAFNSPFVRNTGTFTVGYRILLQGDSGYCYRGIQDTLSGWYRILLRGTFTVGYRILFTGGYRILLQGDTGYLQIWNPTSIDHYIQEISPPSHPHPSLFLIISPLKVLQFNSKEVFAYLVNTILTISTS